MFDKTKKPARYKDEPTPYLPGGETEAQARKRDPNADERETTEARVEREAKEALKGGEQTPALPDQSQTPAPQDPQVGDPNDPRNTVGDQG